MTAARRWFLLCAIGAAVLGLHALLLQSLGPAWLDPDGLPAAAAPAVRVRSVLLTPAPASLEPPPSINAAAQSEPVRMPLPRRGAVAAVPPVGLAASAASSEPLVAEVPVAAAAPLVDHPPPPAGVFVDVPVYATRLPPAGRWRYRLQRGLAVGEAVLHWAPRADDLYELQLEGRVAGVTLLEWVSHGQIDAAGIAPERFAVRRRGRDHQAANFQREAAKITFSGPSHELPLIAGAQDRLSWLVQLAAIVAAAPERFTSGANVVLFVAGARGDADVWTFVVQGLETLDGTSVLKLLREPRKLYDTRAEVWLDPADHYLPMRAVQTPSGGGAALELLRAGEAR